MNKLFKLFLVTIFVFNLPILAKNYQISSIKEVLGYLKPNKAQIVVFDIDNTLLCSKQDLGSDQWISAVAKDNMEKGMSATEAYDQILPIYFHIQNHINLVLTESDLIDTVKLIEQTCDHTICLTARSPKHLMDITLDQLVKNNLFFQVPEVNQDNLSLPEGAIYKEGVLFCGHNCKGEVLLEFLAACHYQPEEIILVDDKLYNLEAVAKQLSQKGIEFVGLRYAGCDQRIANFDMDKTSKDLIEFLKLNPFKDY